MSRRLPEVLFMLCVFVSTTRVYPQTPNPWVGPGEWTWIGGSNSSNVAGTYGKQGVSAASNAPGGRYSPVSWTDSKGNFWLFGGYGVDSVGNAGFLNDLWEYNPRTQNWTWISGSDTSGQSGIYGMEGVPATTNTPGGRLYATGSIDRNDKLWLFGGKGLNSTGAQGDMNDLWEFDPVANTWTWVTGSNGGGPSSTYSPDAREGAGSWFDGSDNLWLLDGWRFNDLWKFDPVAKTWTW